MLEKLTGRVEEYREFLSFKEAGNAIVASGRITGKGAGAAADAAGGAARTGAGAAAGAAGTAARTSAGAAAGAAGTAARTSAGAAAGAAGAAAGAAGAAGRKVDDVAGAATGLKKPSVPDDLNDLGTKLDDLAAENKKLLKQLEANPAALKSADDAGKSWMSKNPKFTIGLLAGGAFVGYGIYKAQKAEETPLTITNIKQYTDGGSKTEYLVTYTPTLEILPTDGVTITGSKTVPSIDGSPSAIVKIRGPSSFVLDLGVTLTKLDPGGTIKITSSFLAQAGTAAGETAGTVAGAVGQGAGAGLSAAAKGIGGAASSLFDSLGLGEYTMYIGGASALCSCLCCMMIVAYILKQVNH